jgi:hypothetical protein
MTTNNNGYLIRQRDKVAFLTYQKYSLSSSVYAPAKLYHIEIEDNNFYLHYDMDNNPYTLDTAPYIIINNFIYQQTNNLGFKLNKGDVIKIGRYKFKIRAINFINNNKNINNNNKEKNIKNNKEILKKNIINKEIKQNGKKEKKKEEKELKEKNEFDKKKNNDNEKIVEVEQLNVDDKKEKIENNEENNLKEIKNEENSENILKEENNEVIKDLKEME